MLHKIFGIFTLVTAITSIHELLSEITQNGLKLVVLDFGFLCDELVQHRLRSDPFVTQCIFASFFVADYILAGTYGTNYILYGTDYIQTGMDGTHYIGYCNMTTN